MESIIGHGDILRTFDRVAARGALAHAYLLVGPRGVGKATIARWMARRLLCQQSSVSRRQSSGHAPATPHVVPCGSCRVCTHVERGIHPDVATLCPEERSIGVAAARAWTDTLRCSSLLNGWKIGIIEDGTMLTEEAANAVLKLLEEPSGQTLLMIAAPHVRRVLPTVASRCAILRCRALPSHVLRDALAERGIADADRLAGDAEGCPGRALTAAQHRTAHENTSDCIPRARVLLHAPMSDRMRFVEIVSRTWSKDRVAAREECGAWIAAFVCIAREYARSSRATAPSWYTMIVRAPQYLHANVSPRLILESLVTTAP